MIFLRKKGVDWQVPVITQAMHRYFLSEKESNQMPLYGIPHFLFLGAGEISRNRNARIQSLPHMLTISVRKDCRAL